MRRLIAATVFAAILMSCAIAHAKAKTPITKDRIELQTDYGTVILQNISIEQSGYEVLVSGTVTNHASRAWRYIAFSFTFRDKSGKELKSDLSGDDSSMRQADIASLGKDETKPFKNYGEEGPAKLSLFLHGKIADFDVQWARANSFYDSHTTFALVQPSQNKTLSHEDESILIQFEVANTELQFKLSNKTPEPLSINWDEVSYIDLNGTAHKVIHQGVKLVDRDKSQTPTVLPPGTNISDLVEPTDAVRFSTLISDWEHDPLLPPSQEIVKFKGKTFGVFMPLTVNGKKKNYSFIIRIEDVQI